MIIYQRFEWDVRSAAMNLTKHGISFKEAATVFADEGHAVTAAGGTLLRAVGRSERGRALVVTHEAGPRIRIVGAELNVPKPEVREPVQPEAPKPPAEANASKTNGHAAKTNGHAAKTNGHASKTNGHATKAATIPQSVTMGPPAAPNPGAQRAPEPEKAAPAPPAKREPRAGSWKAAARILAERLAAEERAREAG